MESHSEPIRKGAYGLGITGRCTAPVQIRLSHSPAFETFFVYGRLDLDAVLCMRGNEFWGSRRLRGKLWPQIWPNMGPCTTTSGLQSGKERPSWAAFKPLFATPSCSIFFPTLETFFDAAAS